MIYERILELKQKINDTKNKLNNMGIVINYETADKFEKLTKLITKYEHQFVILKKQYNKEI